MAPDPLEALYSRLNAGEHEEVINELHALLDKGVEYRQIRRLLALAYLKAGYQDLASEQIVAARSAKIDDPADDIAFGRMLRREGFAEAALESFLFAVKVNPSDDEAHALVSMTYHALGRLDDAIAHGQIALDLRDDHARRTPHSPITSARTKQFSAQSRDRNIISFSLFGEDEYYWDCAMANASMALAIYPEWRCRFYCDPRIPRAILENLQQRRAEVLVSPDPSLDWRGLFWRFWAFDDPNVDVVLVRDVDSPFTLRERLAVDQWLQSDFPFHVMRDHINHTEPIMAGLWGGWTRMLPALHPMTLNASSYYGDRYADQRFLRLTIWPRIRDVTLAHDRYYRLGETVMMPEHVTEKFVHVGGAWPRYRPRESRDARSRTRQEPTGL